MRRGSVLCSRKSTDFWVWKAGIESSSFRKCTTLSSIADMANYHKLCGFKYKFIILHFWWSEVQNALSGLKSGWHSSWRLYRRTHDPASSSFHQFSMSRSFLGKPPGQHAHPAISLLFSPLPPNPLTRPLVTLLGPPGSSRRIFLFKVRLLTTLIPSPTLILLCHGP